MALGILYHHRFSFQLAGFVLLKAGVRRRQFDTRTTRWMWVGEEAVVSKRISLFTAYGYVIGAFDKLTIYVTPSNYLDLHKLETYITRVHDAIEGQTWQPKRYGPLQGVKQRDKIHPITLRLAWNTLQRLLVSWNVHSTLPLSKLTAPSSPQVVRHTFANVSR